MSYYPNIGIPADHINFGISKVRETEWERHVRAYEAHERLLEELPKMWTTKKSMTMKNNSQSDVL